MSQDNEVVAENENIVDCAFGLVGRKIGMSRIFQDDGTSIPVTIIEVAKKCGFGYPDSKKKWLRRNSGCIRGKEKI
jgi:hypothetical protein